MKTNLHTQIKSTMTENNFEKVFLIYLPKEYTLRIDYNYYTTENPVEKVECTLEEFTTLLTFVINDPFFDGKVTVEYGTCR